MKEYYWNYHFVQHTPTYLSFKCSLDFVYLRKKQIEANGKTDAWKEVYEKTDIAIDLERDAILERPGLYY